MLPRYSGQGLMQEKWKDSVPWSVITAERRARFSLWSGLCHMDKLPTRAAPGVEPV